MSTPLPALSECPAVSVLMAIHGGKAYLPEALQSVLSQDFADFEVVLVDDASPDGTRELARDLARTDSRVRLFERDHAGQVASLNFGLTQCRAPLVARMDGDDVCLPGRFAAQVAAFEADPGLVLCGGGYELIDAKGRLLRIEYPPVDDATLQEQCLAGTTPICHPLAMMRREAVERVGGYDPNFAPAEDLNLWLGLGEIGRLACVPKVVLQYRMHASSLSQTQAGRQAENIRRGCEAAYARRGLPRTFVPPAAWRPSGAEQQYQFLLRYGWWGLSHQKRATGLAYGLSAVRARPTRKAGWMLAASALLKPLPTPPPVPAAYRQA